MSWFHKRLMEIVRYSLLVVILALSPQFSYGSPLTLPPTRHHQFLTNALMTDESVYLIARDAGRTLCALGSSAAFLEFDWWGSAKAQVIGTGMIRTAIRLNGFKTESLDADLGAALEVRESASFRWTLRMIHTSGHAVDGVEFPALNPPNLGMESVSVRAVYDVDQRIRLGASLRFNFDVDPGFKRIWAQQFVDYFPLGDEGDARRGRWFVSLGLEELGVSQWNLAFTAQTGISFGSFFSDDHIQQARLALGFYTGPDPRMKYYAFLNQTVMFPFIGLFFRV